MADNAINREVLRVIGLSDATHVKAIDIMSACACGMRRKLKYFAITADSKCVGFV